MLTVGSLFSGIGGIDLGLEWTGGFKTIWFVENNPYCQKVLAKHWPEVPCYGDIKTVDFRTLPRPDLLCGGFPCQPFSMAGARKGLSDARWLWGEYLKAICSIKPRWVLVENVPGLLSIESGYVFGHILRDLAESRYDAEWQVLSAAQFGAPHLRNRIFIIAYPSSPGVTRRQVFKINRYGRNNGRKEAEILQGETSNSNNIRFQDSRRGYPSIYQQEKGNRKREIIRNSSRWTNMQWSVEPNVGRVAHGVPSRMDRLRCLGNAVVPQVIQWIGERILQCEQ